MGEEGGTGMESVEKQKSYLVLLVCYCRNIGTSVFYGKKYRERVDQNLQIVSNPMVSGKRCSNQTKRFGSHLK